VFNEVPVPAPPPAPPPPPAAKQAAKGVSPRGNPGSWATTEDYPSRALREEKQGTTGFRLEVGADGRVTSCTVTQSSGSPELDDATCKLVSRRARFSPAEDDQGNKIPSTYANRIQWRIPQ
jgi:protein TonB